MDKEAKIFVAGHRGLVGSALCKVLTGYNVLTVPRSEIDLANRQETEWFFSVHRPEYVFLSAAKVGGIAANAKYPVDFLTENFRIQDNVLAMAWRYNTKKLLFLSSACAYPKHATCPISESALLTGPLEPTNSPYALAKISGVALCDAYRRQHGCDFISAIPTNLYGRHDHYDLENSHVLPGMLRRFHEARDEKEVVLWGTGTPTREFLFAEDLARACVCLMDSYSEEGPINVGGGAHVRLCQLAELIQDVVKFKGEIVWDASKPDGTPNRLLDSTRIFKLGWYPRVPLTDGLPIAYIDFLQSI